MLHTRPGCAPPAGTRALGLRVPCCSAPQRLQPQPGEGCSAPPAPQAGRARPGCSRPLPLPGPGAGDAAGADVSATHHCWAPSCRPREAGGRDQHLPGVMVHLAETSAMQRAPGTGEHTPGPSRWVKRPPGQCLLPPRRFLFAEQRLGFSSFEGKRGILWRPQSQGARSQRMSLEHPRLRRPGSSRAIRAACAWRCPISHGRPSFSWSPSAILGTRLAPERPAHGDAKVALGHRHPLPALCPVPSLNADVRANLGLFSCPREGWEQAARLEARQGWSRGVAAVRCLWEPPARRQHIAALAGRLVMLAGAGDRYQARSLSALSLQRRTEARMQWVRLSQRWS